MSHKAIQRLRRAAFQRQGSKCFYCQLPMWDDAAEEFCRRFRMSARHARSLQCTAEHLRARQDGGEDTHDNIVAACAWCNKRRHQGRHDKAPDPLIYKCRVAARIARGKWHPVLGLVMANLREGVSNDPNAGN